MFAWQKHTQIHTFQNYQKEVNDKYLESSNIQHTGPLACKTHFWAEHIKIFCPRLNFEMSVLEQIQSDDSDPILVQSDLRLTFVCFDFVTISLAQFVM